MTKRAKIISDFIFSGAILVGFSAIASGIYDNIPELALYGLGYTGSISYIFKEKRSLDNSSEQIRKDLKATELEILKQIRFAERHNEELIAVVKPNNQYNPK